MKGQGDGIVNLLGALARTRSGGGKDGGKGVLDPHKVQQSRNFQAHRVRAIRCRNEAMDLLEGTNEKTGDLNTQPLAGPLGMELYYKIDDKFVAYFREGGNYHDLDNENKKCFWEEVDELIERYELTTGKRIARNAG